MPPVRRVKGQREVAMTDKGYEAPMAPSVGQGPSLRFSIKVMSQLFQLESKAEGRLKVVRTAEELSSCMRSGVLAMVIHFEGAEAIDKDLDVLEVLYQSGLRSLGLVWSRPNAFAHGVPFKFPHSPDTGPGLTSLGKELVSACNRLGLMVDVSHLNEAGFWDVAAISERPLVASHANAHALCPSTRNLTDRQLEAIRDSGGLAGINFHVGFLRSDGKREADTPLSEVVRHVDYLVERMGIDNVAFGSDFDGAVMPAELGDVTGLPRLMGELRSRGYDDDALRKVGHENWIRVLSDTWN
jgi:membrane dipeptidase